MGLDAKLTQTKLIEQLVKYTILEIKEKQRKWKALSQMGADLRIHLDLKGEYSEGIVGLRARRNPDPIDLRKEKYYKAEDYYEPLKAENGCINLKRGEYYLFSSKEVLNIPRHLSVELERGSHLGFMGPLHFAGFIDNGFNGDLVFEIRSDELSDLELIDGMPVSTLNFYRSSEEPDKKYGRRIGSHYQDQVGPMPPKFFKPFDFKRAAKEYKKLDRIVITQDANILNSYRKKKSGFEWGDEKLEKILIKTMRNGIPHSRYDCDEVDELALQYIPYVLLLGPNKTIFEFVRAKKIKHYGEPQLFGKWSVGTGGHINKGERLKPIGHNIKREVFVQEVQVPGRHSKPRFFGTIMAYRRKVDRRHFGMIYVVSTDGRVYPNEKSIPHGEMVPISKLTETDTPRKYETWTRCLIPFLDEIYQKFYKE